MRTSNGCPCSLPEGGRAGPLNVVDAKILAPCPPMPNRNTETVWRQQKRVALLFCQAKGKHSRLVPQELCPLPWGIGKGYIARGFWSGVGVRLKVIKVLHFFSSANSWPKLAVRWLSNRVWCPWSYHQDLLSEMKSATREGRGRRNARCKGWFTWSQRAVSVVKDESSYKRLLVVNS